MSKKIIRKRRLSLKKVILLLSIVILILPATLVLTSIAKSGFNVLGNIIDICFKLSYELAYFIF